MKSGPEKTNTQESKPSARDTQRGGVAFSPLAYGVGVVDQGAGVARPNRTGLPDKLKAGIESLSGYSMDNVRVFYNSPKPAQLRALAYTQGTDIHVGPGQEKHVPHEAWHVVQQAQGRVQATMQMKGVGVNDDAGLEREADEMGGRAMQGSSASEMPAREPSGRVRNDVLIPPRSEVVQCVKKAKSVFLGRDFADGKCIIAVTGTKGHHAILYVETVENENSTVIKSYELLATAPGGLRVEIKHKENLTPENIRLWGNPFWKFAVREISAAGAIERKAAEVQGKITANRYEYTTSGTCLGRLNPTKDPINCSRFVNKLLKVAGLPILGDWGILVSNDFSRHPSDTLPP